MTRRSFHSERIFGARDTSLEQATTRSAPHTHNDINLVDDEVNEHSMTPLVDLRPLTN